MTFSLRKQECVSSKKLIIGNTTVDRARARPPNQMRRSSVTLSCSNDDVIIPMSIPTWVKVRVKLAIPDIARMRLKAEANATLVWLACQHSLGRGHVIGPLRREVRSTSSEGAVWITESKPDGPAARRQLGHASMMDGGPNNELDRFSRILPLPYRVALIIVLGTDTFRTASSCL